MKKHGGFITLLALSALASPSISYAQQDGGSVEFQVDELFAELDRPDSPGAAALVVRDGRVRDGLLVARHRRHAEIEFTPVQRDEFRGSEWFFGKVEFDRDEDERVVGMSVTQQRSRNMKFVRRSGGRG